MFAWSEPVSAGGVLLARRRLTTGSGPLSGRGVPERLRAAASAILVALDGG
jgi:hypothetical protein